MSRNYLFLTVSSIYFLVTLFQIFQTLIKPKVGPMGNGTIAFEIYTYLFFATLGSVSLFVLSIYQIIKKKKQVS